LLVGSKSVEQSERIFFTQRRKEKAKARKEYATPLRASFFLCAFA
jgi:hypothetical protein